MTAKKVMNIMSKCFLVEMGLATSTVGMARKGSCCLIECKASSKFDDQRIPIIFKA
jgi:hypothetical protein